MAATATLIPSGGRRPDAGSVGAAEYIDATVHKVPSIRPALLRGIDEVERIARESTGHAFTGCSAQERENVLRQFFGGLAVAQEVECEAEHHMLVFPH
jgi:hypothetical protein